MEVGVEAYACARGRAAKEIHQAALTSQAYGPLPGLRCSHRLKHHICPTTLWRELSRCRNGVTYLDEPHDLRRTETARHAALIAALHHGDDFEAHQPSRMDEQQPDRAGSQHDGGLPSPSRTTLPDLALRRRAAL